MKKKVKYEKILKSRSSSHTKKTVNELDEIELKFRIFTTIAGSIGIVIWGIIGIIMNWNFFMQNTEPEESITESSVLSLQEKKQKLLTLVNTSTVLPDDYPLELETYNNIQIDSLLINDLTDLISAAEQNDIILNISEGYISHEEQFKMYTAEINHLLSLGYTKSQAASIAETTVPLAGHAEQQTGLSVRFDIADNVKTQAWLERNSFKYGFILRYPDDRTDITNHNGDPTLFRYVGKSYALQMRTLNMCLEEYLIYLNRR